MSPCAELLLQASEDPVGLIARADSETNEHWLCLIGVYLADVPPTSRGAALTRLRAQLGHADYRVRIGAIYGLGRRNLPNEYRGRATADTDPRVRQVAQEWLDVNEPPGQGGAGLGGR